MELFRNDEIDAVYLLYNEFKSVMAQKLTLTRVLPVELPKQSRAGGLHLRAAAGEMLDSAAAALRGNRDLPRAAGIRRRRARRAHDRHGSGHLQRIAK